MLEFSISVLILGFGGVGIFALYKYICPFLKSKKYIDYYKVGRVSQIAKTRGFDIDEMILSEEQKQEKINNKYTDLDFKMERELASEIGEFEINHTKSTSKK